MSAAEPRVAVLIPEPEGYRIRTTGRRIEIAGSDKRGVLYGVGRLLRSLDWATGRVSLAEALNVEAKPAAKPAAKGPAGIADMEDDIPF